MLFYIKNLLKISGLIVLFSGCSLTPDTALTDAKLTMPSPITQPIVMNLYSAEIPFAKPSDDLERIRDKTNPAIFLRQVTFPTLTAYFANSSSNETGGSAKPNAAVIICPGGGYGGVSIVKEGYDVAKRFNQIGVTAFVLKYRDPLDETMQDKKFGPLQDVQQAIAWVRKQSKEWNIDPDRIGVMGFSAGGHLASSAAVHFNRPVLAKWQPEQVKPNFQILIYPVISFADDIGHQGSKKRLLGKQANPEWQTYFSNERQVQADTPEAFMVHAGDDPAVLVDNSIRYYQALNAKKVAAQLLIVPDGKHGFGLDNSFDWFESLAQWMESRNLIYAP